MRHVNWRKIAITLIEAEKGEVKTQACAIAWLRQLSFVHNVALLSWV